MAFRKMTQDYLVKLLLEKGLLSEDQVVHVQKSFKTQRKKLVRKYRQENVSDQRQAEDISSVDVLASYALPLVGRKEKILTEDLIMKAVAEDAGLPFRKIDPLELDLDIVTKTLPRSFALKHLVVPVELVDDTLEVAIYNPFNRGAVLDDVRRVSKYDIKPVLSTKTDIKKLISEFYGFKTSIIGAEGQFTTPQVDLGNLEQYVRLRSTEEIQATDQHIKNAVDYLIGYAFEQRASDIHIEPKRNETLIRMRIDGILHNVYRLPKTIHPAIVSRIKTLSRLDMAEKRRPQDGRIKIEHQEQEAEIRVSTVPVAFGEKAVLRILNPEILFQDLDNLGLAPSDLIKYKDFIHRPHGINLVTGPTGSGKSTTLYSTLRHIGSPEKNITTIEDPIEMVFEDFNQIGVQPQVDITFANILRYVLRQDPDIIMIGELRDSETAEYAIQAALTGHLVLSTLHTNDAPLAITRMIDLGVKPFLVASTLIGVEAQRLLRCVCVHCKEDFFLTQEEALNLGLKLKGQDKIKLSRGRGCEKCRGTGYLGRRAIFEVMPYSEKLKQMTLANQEASALRAVAKSEGMISLRENALRLMLQGITTYQEVLQVTAEE
ncbi:MAG: type II/IV secretion system protein [Deltaproteobacteria bacterium]|nr:type II/IV secretion system protein [Deltaproteobacteria bacterium]MBW2052228.1 type II/IV secretion system protein [Deltaproteobacteria bacterium]MBW2141039.1 type II/IV secretion system protein [Deltaproteobacteria bacterium]MBW2323486.1 type II/IV secretion system protein [Deltaproteobacteria bacterium]